jgi:hypothetical protein
MISKMNVKDIIINKINEITKEHQELFIKWKDDLDYINTITMQFNSMKAVLEELLIEIESE